MRKTRLVKSPAPARAELLARIYDKRPVWQLIKDGKILKEHSTRLACWIEAIERHLVVSWGMDFPGDRPGVSLGAGVEIKEKVDG